MRAQIVQTEDEVAAENEEQEEESGEVAGLMNNSNIETATTDE